MSFARAYSYHLPRQASADETSAVYDSIPPLLLSPSHRSRLASMTPSSRLRQPPNAASPLLLDTEKPLQHMEPLSIDASTPHAHYTAPSYTAKHASLSYVDSVLATPRPGYTPTRYISPEYWRIFMGNFRTLFTLAWPVILSYLLQFSQGIVNLVFIGHISAEKLAAAALGNMVRTSHTGTTTCTYSLLSISGSLIHCLLCDSIRVCVCQYANITGYAVAFGLATAVDTLCSQAYGAGSLMLIGLVVQRAACIMIVTSMPIFVLWYYCADLLILLKQDPAISAEAGQYVWRLAPSLIPYLLFELLKKYLIAQRIMKPMIVVLLLTSLCHVLLVYLFIYPLGMGFLGAPSATATAQCLMLVIGVLVIYHRGYHKQTWPRLSTDIFRGWLPILRFGLPGMFMLCLEWWSFELCALAAGWMGAIQLDSFVVLLQVQSFIFMIPLGLSIAISTVTGNRLGAGQPGLAKQGAAVAIGIGLVTQTMVAVILILARTQVGRLFSDDQSVVDMVTEVFPITGVMLLFDAMQVVCGGVLRGLGYQSIGAITNLAGFYLFVSHTQLAHIVLCMRHPQSNSL